MRRISLEFVPTAILSRQVGVLREGDGHAALILNLPGQPKAIAETLEGLKAPDGPDPGARHLRRRAVLHRPDRRPVHRDARRRRQGVSPEERTAEAGMTELLQCVEVQTEPLARRDRDPAARPRCRRLRLRAGRARARDAWRPGARYVFPHAPTMPVTINGGYVMRAWYDILGTDLVRREDEHGIRASQAMVEALIEREVDRGVAAVAHRAGRLLAGGRDHAAHRPAPAAAARGPDRIVVLPAAGRLVLAVRRRPAAPGRADVPRARHVRIPWCRWPAGQPRATSCRRPGTPCSGTTTRCRIP